MTTDKVISSSCQSVATISLGPAISTSNVIPVGTDINNDEDNDNHGNINYGHYVPGMGSLGRLKFNHQKYKSINGSDEDLDYSQLSQSTHLLGRVKSERFLAGISKTNEDRRRRTIIVEKKNGTFGFTLQSYGIHYKKDQEVEMITYVDYVEYDGPAYKAGMREGDVILAINGKDMEKADHKTIVDYIKSCDTRMRLVVLFENCVRKVDLHMRYIQLQNLLQSKMNELEQICLRERELLEGKWKTHSLPARKKAAASPIIDDNSNVPDGLNICSNNDRNLAIHRSTYSTEDMANIVRQSQQIIIPPPAQFTFSYQCLNPTYRYILKPSNSTSSTVTATAADDCFITITESVPHIDTVTTKETNAAATQQQSLRKNSLTHGSSSKQKLCEKHKASSRQKDHQQQQSKKEMNATQKSKHCHGQSCNPCIDLKWKKAAASGINADNISLEAYDLASPCCDTHCVPMRRRPRHHSKEHHSHHKHKHRGRETEYEGGETKGRSPRPKSQYHVSSKTSENNNARINRQSYEHPHQHYHHRIGIMNITTAIKEQHQRHCHASKQQQQQQILLQQQCQQQQKYQQLGQMHHHHRKSPEEGLISQNGSIKSRYFDLTSDLASHCSLHSCESSQDFKPADSSSYTTSFSSDTLFWDPKSENAASSRQHSTKSRQSQQQQQFQQESQPQPQSQQQQQLQPDQQQQYYHVHRRRNQQGKQQQEQQEHQLPYAAQNVYQHRYHITATHINPTQIYPNTAFAYKPKSWDNLTAATITAHGYGYLDTLAVIKPFNNIQIVQQRHSIPRKNGPYGRYSTYADTIENYAPPPTEFVEQLTTTTTTITAKSNDNLLESSALKSTSSACDCVVTTQQQHQNHALQQQQQQQKSEAVKLAQLQINQQNQNKMSSYNHCQMGYYSHLPQPKIDAATSTASIQNAQLHNNLSEKHNKNSNNSNVSSSSTAITSVTGTQSESTRL